MPSVEELELQVAALSESELARFRQWFAEFDADAWDRQMSEDFKAGKFDAMAEEAMREFRAGKITPF